jgi:hypothetical protein
MVDDDVSTLLKLDEKGFHAGGTVQAGSRPLFVASGGFTVNPPDLASAGDRLRSLLTSARDTVQEAAKDLPDPSPTVGDAIEALRSAVADLRSDLPDTPDLRASAAGLAAAIPNALPSPDPDRLVADARELTERARQAVGLAPQPRSVMQRLPRWLPGGLLAVGLVAATGAAIVLWDPVRGAERRARLRGWFAGLRGRLDALRGREPLDMTDDEDQPSPTAPLAFTAIPVERSEGTPVVGVQLRN